MWGDFTNWLRSLVTHGVRIEQKLDALINLAAVYVKLYGDDLRERKEFRIMATQTMTELAAAVRKMVNTADSAATALRGIRTRLDEALNQQDMGLVAQLRDELNKEEGELATSIADTTSGLDPAPDPDPNPNPDPAPDPAPENQ